MAQLGEQYDRLRAEMMIRLDGTLARNGVVLSQDAFLAVSQLMQVVIRRTIWLTEEKQMGELLTFLGRYEQRLQLPYLTSLWTILYTDGSGKLVDTNHEYHEFETLEELLTFLRKECGDE